MDLQQRINAFAKLGEFLSQFKTEGIEKNDSVIANDLFFDGLKHQLKLAREHNGWFTEKNIFFSIKSWSNVLTNKNIILWTSKYNFNIVKPKNVAIIMAGNIPLVGFHDFLSVLISGHNVLVKQSSNDKYLLPFLAKYLEIVEPEFKGKIKFTEEKLQDFEAVIATGSDNTARYFEYYFKDKPSIIRKNRNSVAVLSNNETKEQLEALSNDILDIMDWAVETSQNCLYQLIIISTPSLMLFINGILLSMKPNMLITTITIRLCTGSRSTV